MTNIKPLGTLVLVEKIEENDNGDKEHIECFCNNKCNIL